MEKMIVFGASGLLGINLLFFFKDRYKVYAIKNNQQIDIDGVDVINLKLNSSIDVLEDIIESIKPKLVINTIGYTNIQYCENNENETYFTHVKIPKKISELCNKRRIKFIHISTDHISNGENEYISENQEFTPLNVYGKTKLEGDNQISINNKNALIIRANFFGWGPSYRTSFSDYIINHLRGEKEIILNDNIYFTPIFINNLIKLIFKLYKDDKKGIYNIGSLKKISKYNFGVLIANKSNLNSNLLKNESYLNKKIKKPLDMSLSTSKIRSDLSVELKNVENEISDLFDFQKNNIYDELKAI